MREELESGAYQLDIPVQICMMVNMREICRVGEGRLHHDENGFHLTGCGGKLDYFQKPEASSVKRYSLLQLRQMSDVPLPSIFPSAKQCGHL